MSLVPIVIPFFREHDKLKKCLAAIAAQTYPGCEPFVRDNTHDNIYYTAAVNEGLARYCSRPDVDYVMVLNQDAYLHADCVRALVAFMESHPDCGIACPLQLDEGGSTVTWGGSLQAFPTGVHRTDKLASYAAPMETHWGNGACMVIRAETIREVGRFDRNMRFICSDADFSFTARARGWKVYVVPAARVTHSLGASGSESNPELELVKNRDIQYFARKWLNGGLYRELSFEGSRLTRIGTRLEIENLRRYTELLERRLGRAKPAGPVLYPSWTAATQLPPPRKGGFR
jgi:GT2 family glycosyltransferase